MSSLFDCYSGCLPVSTLTDSIVYTFKQKDSDACQYKDKIWVLYKGLGFLIGPFAEFQNKSNLLTSRDDQISVAGIKGYESFCVFVLNTCCLIQTSPMQEYGLKTIFSYREWVPSSSNETYTV
jgi:hypothetical protein